MKILILSSVSLKSGTGLRIRSIAGHLAKVGHEVWITGKDIDKIDNVKTINIKKHFGPVTYLSGIRAGLSVLRNTFDVVIASKPHPVSCIPVLLKRPKSKLILDFDDLEHAYWKDTPFYILMKLFENMFPKKFDAVTVHNEYLRKYLIGMGVKTEKIINLPQGIECDLFKNIKRRKTQKKTIIYMAHLGVAAKDLDFILKGIRKLLEKRNDVVFSVIGGGPKLEYYKKLSKDIGIEKHVRFEGMVKHSDIPKHLSYASVAVNYMKPNEANRSRSSIKIREYLASGIPVVCNIFGPDLAQFKNFVFDFKPDNEYDFAEKVDEALRSNGSKKGRQYVLSKFNWGNIIKKFSEVLETKL
jgi:glycosyltransferase involved in cell wall biosynthesis